MKYFTRDFELQDWIRSIILTRGGTDREAVIISASMVDHGLEAAIKREFVDLNKEEYGYIFEGTGPLSSFSAKIKLGHALGILNSDAKIDLEIIKDIRNTFAHSIHEIDLNINEISFLCSKLSFINKLKTIIPEIDSDWEIKSARGRFLMSTFLYANLFLCAPSDCVGTK